MAVSRHLDAYVPNIVLRHLIDTPDARTRVVDGTLLFADISGFTKLSERLAKRGRQGAEELVDVLGAAFAELLAEAYRNDGSLLKFGGDALLLLFDGPGHVDRAARSAFGMRRRLRSLGALQTSAGKVTLRMSQGMHSGAVHLFFAQGTSHRELIVSGPAATAVVEMEKLAGAGEIAISPSTAAGVPEVWLGAKRGRGWLLTSAPKGREPGPSELSTRPPTGAIEQFLSREVRAHVAGGQLQPEHRVVTTAFLRFEGVDELIAQEGLEAAADAIEDLVAHAQAAADEFEVCFLQSDVDADGGKLTLTAGAPRMVGDDEERMLLALRQIVAGPHRLPLRIGVNRGSVFCGDVGAPFRRAYTIMGDAVNLAARLMSHAPAGEIYATPGVLERSATRFDVQPMAAFTVKGKRDPVEAWSVGSPLGSRAREGIAVRFPLVGRDPELAALGDALAAARAGVGRLVEIAGEPGIGKTRLAEELRARAGGMSRLRITCEAYTSATPYVVWRDLLRPLVGAAWEDPDSIVGERLRTAVRELEPELEPWLPLLAIPLGADLPPTPEVAELAPGFRRARLHEVTLRFLRARLPDPALIEIEDAHQMDAASADLLGALTAQVDAMPWLVVTARRDVRGGFVAPENDNVLHLTPHALPPDATLALAEAVTDTAPVPPHRLRLAVERSGGNPQLLRDLLRSVGAGEETLPDSIETAALARVDRLAPAERTLVRRAAVLGVSFHPRHLADVLDPGFPEPDADTWDRLSDVITEMGEGYLRFRRSVVRDAAYAALPFALRRRLHANVAARLATERNSSLDELAPALSLHYSRAGDTPEAWTYARLAAGHASQRLAFADASVLLRRALEAARSLAVSEHRLAETWEALADALAHTGELADAHAALRAARDQAGDDPFRRAELLLAHARLAERAGNVPAAVRWANRALRLVDGEREPAAVACRAQTLSVLATVRQREGRFDDAIALCRRVIADAEDGADTDPGLAASLAHAWFILDWALYDIGRPEEATHSRGALAIYERLGDLDRQAAVLNNLGGFAYHEGRWHDAVELYQRGAEASERAGDTANAAFGACNTGEVLSDQGLLDEARHQLRRALRIWRGSEYDWGTAFATTLLGRAAVRAGHHAEGLDLLEQGFTDFQRLRALPDAGLAEAYTAEGLAFAGRPDAALLAADRALRDATRTAPLLHRVRGFALAQRGDADGALHAFHASLRDAEERANLYEIAITLDALLALGGAPAGSAARRAALLEQLGVEALPDPPVSPAFRDRRAAATR